MTDLSTPVSKPCILYRSPKRRFTSSRSNDDLKAQWFGKEHKNMPPRHYAVWFGMQRFARRWNMVDARFRDIATFLEISLGSVQRAMAYFEQHDFVVRVPDPDKRRKVCWMINPRLQWNWSSQEQESGLAVYRKYRRDVGLKRIQQSAKEGLADEDLEKIRESEEQSKRDEEEYQRYRATMNNVDDEDDEMIEPDWEDEQLCASR